MQTGDRTVYKVAQKWEECLGQVGTSWCAEMCAYVGSKRRKAHPVLSAGSGTQFPPKTAKGKHIPF